ncbi:MAG: ABC transporter ATP-binding protein [Syntrophomonadaceae bacterium]|nr:ABC transporter ATP-binding protein [Syntrophomonadaceae bacterium]
MIKISKLSKTYSTGTFTVPALKGISLEIEPGEFVAITGASGSGKSTMMNLLGLLDRPSAGSYILDGMDVSNLDDNEYASLRNRKIGFVFQAFNLLPRLTALKNVELSMLYAGIKLEERRKRAVEGLTLLGLEDRLHHFPNELSGGQNQRVAIARALANQPAIILADEPTGALDSQTGLEIMSIFQELNRHGTTVVLVTHELNIAQHSRRILRMADGLLVADEEVTHPLDAREELQALREKGAEA